MLIEGKAFFFEESGGARLLLQRIYILKKLEYNFTKGRSRVTELQSYRGFGGPRKKEKKIKVFTERSLSMTLRLSALMVL
jgi:hypothetical protein